MKFFAVSAVLLCGVVWAGSPAAPRIIDGTTVPASDFPSVGQVSTDEALGTGTLISPQHVLTAAHVVLDENGDLATGITFELGGKSYRASRVIIHPSYTTFLALREIATDADHGRDAAIIELIEAVPDARPSRYVRQPLTVGTPVLLVGYGNGGSGAGGEDESDDSGPPAGSVRKGPAAIQTLESAVLRWTIDPGVSGIASGDSGGPVFIDEGGELVVAGVHESISIGSAFAFGAFGSVCSSTRVDLLTQWIDKILTGSSSNTAPAIDACIVPESAAVGAEIQMTSGATDADGQALQYYWNFGDGIQQRGALTGHTYSLPGTYTVTLFVTDGVDLSSQTRTVTVTAGNAGSAKIMALSFKLDFTGFREDSYSIKGKVTPWVKGESVAGASVWLNIAGNGLIGTLDERGSIGPFFKFNTKQGTFSSKFNMPLQKDWRDDGIEEEDVRGKKVVLAVGLLLGDKAFVGSKTIKYSAKFFKTGMGR